MKAIDKKLCPQVEAAFGLLAKKWAGLIVFMLCDEEKYFVELKTAIPAISSRLLAERMRDLEKMGIIERRVAATSPVRVNYRLTKRGVELASIMKEIAGWARSYL